MVEDQLEDANKQLDRNLGIYQYDQETAQAKAEKEWQKTMDQFGYISESGAVAGLNDKEIRQWAAATGIPESAIRAMKEKSSTVDKQYDVQFETGADGTVTAIYANKNDPMDVQTLSLGRLGKGFAPKEGSGEKEPKDEKVAMEEKDLRTSVRKDLIETISQNPSVTIEQLEQVFPEVSRPLLESYMSTYGAQEEVDTRSMWDKLADWWNKD
jgi:hypothetical protein